MKTIALGLSPNTEKDDIVLAIKQMFSIWSYQRGGAITELEQWFRNFFNVSYAVSFSSGRSALYAVLLSLGVGQGDEVILQSFTCIVVPNAIVAVGAIPIYADINNSLTFDPKSLEKHITSRTKAILVQHTFGIPADMEKIQKIAKKHKLFVIEDVAHTIGGVYKNEKLGTLSDAAIFSFGRDKAFSSVFGGMAITGNKVLGKKIRQYQKLRNYPTVKWISQQLFHPIAFSLILPIYNNMHLGKILLIILQRLKLLSFPVVNGEKRGIFDNHCVKKLPNALAVLAMHQIKKIQQYNQRRKDIAAIYNNICEELKISTAYAKDTPLLRFPIFVDKPNNMRDFFKKYGIYLGDWYGHVIDPKGCNFSSVHYTRGSCLQAEVLASKIVNLPLIPTMTDKDVEKVIAVLRKYYV